MDEYKAILDALDEQTSKGNRVSHIRLNTAYYDSMYKAGSPVIFHSSGHNITFEIDDTIETFKFDLAE